MASTTTRGAIARRLAGVLRVDAAVFEEIESDPAATAQAVLVIATASVSAGVGAALRVGASAFPPVAAASAAGWLLWAALIYVIGRRMLPEPQTSASWGELFRVVGFAAGPGVFLVLGFIPLLGWLVQPAVAAWLLMTMTIGVRQAFDFQSTMRALAVVALGWLAYVVLLALVQVSS